MQDRAATARAGTKAKSASEGFKDCMCFTDALSDSNELGAQETAFK